MFMQARTCKLNDAWPSLLSSTVPSMHSEGRRRRKRVNTVTEAPVVHDNVLYASALSRKHHSAIGPGAECSPTPVCRLRFSVACHPPSLMSTPRLLLRVNMSASFLSLSLSGLDSFLCIWISKGGKVLKSTFALRIIDSLDFATTTLEYKTYLPSLISSSLSELHWIIRYNWKSCRLLFLYIIYLHILLFHSWVCYSIRLCVTFISSSLCSCEYILILICKRHTPLHLPWHFSAAYNPPVELLCGEVITCQLCLFLAITSRSSLQASRNRSLLQEDIIFCKRPWTAAESHCALFLRSMWSFVTLTNFTNFLVFNILLGMTKVTRGPDLSCESEVAVVYTEPQGKKGEKKHWFYL